MPGHSTEIANEFLKRADHAGRSLTQMQLQKLVYLAHGISLAVLDRPLVIDQVEAWDYGPVYREMYKELRQYGADPVRASIKTPVEGGGLVADEIASIDYVWRTFGDFPAFKLSALTHLPDTPWSKVYSELGASAPIPNSAIKDYFHRIRRQSV
jgi:uncharacterized phage-associated protein